MFLSLSLSSATGVAEGKGVAKDNKTAKDRGAKLARVGKETTTGVATLRTC